MSNPIEIAGRQSREELTRFHRDLRCNLTRSECEAKSAALADALHENDLLVTKHKQAKATMAELEKDSKQTISKLAYDVRTKTEERPVECRWTIDWIRDCCVCERMDTGEEIAVRKIEDHERQRRLA